MIAWLGERTARDLRLPVAQSILLLDLEGRLPRTLLDDAARLGSACIGPVGGAAGEYWPELQATDFADAVRIGRKFLTDAAFAASVADLGERRAQNPVDEHAFADDLRRLSADEAATVGS